MRPSRRGLLIGGGAGVGLIIAYSLWPRAYRHNLRAAPGENVFNAFLKIGADGRVATVIPQMEMGQGAWTALPQILADELGADWRTVSVEAAPLNPLYANALLGAERYPSMMGESAASEMATRAGASLTGGSSSVRAFEGRLRDAGAVARILLCQEAAQRWNVAWEACDASGGFVANAGRRIRFAELAEAAAQRPVPEVVRRAPGSGGLAGRPLPRLDAPAKLDGSASFAGDIRLPGMVHARVRAGPAGARLAGLDKAAAKRDGLIALVERPGWVAAVARDGWTAERALKAARPRFEIPIQPGEVEQDTRFAEAMKAKGTIVAERGDVGQVFGEGTVLAAEFEAAAAAHHGLETLAAASRMTGDRLEIWAPTQAPREARAAAARGAGVSERAVTLYPTFIGGGFGRNFATAQIEQAAVIARAVERPVSLLWSRAEDMLHASPRPAAGARLEARLGPGGALRGWRAKIAAPGDAAAATVGAVPAYASPALEVRHSQVASTLPSGFWRGRAASYTAFFNESFIDELAAKAGSEPLSFRIGLLGGNPRLARVLTTAASVGGWDGGGPGSALGLAAHGFVGSFAAVVAHVAVGADQKIRVRRLVAAVDCGRVVNPDLVRQQIEGGLLWGMAAALGEPISWRNGLAGAGRYGQLGLPRLASSPEILVELIAGADEPGGAEEVAVPPVAPAIANALFALTGQRLRHLPLAIGGR